MANLKSELSASQQAEHRHRAASPSSPPSTSGGSIRRRRSSIHATLIRDKESKQQQMTTRKIHDIKLAFSEFYLSLILLQNYQTLNFTGFRKILKKHDKVKVLRQISHHRYYRLIAIHKKTNTCMLCARANWTNYVHVWWTFHNSGNITAITSSFPQLI